MLSRAQTGHTLCIALGKYVAYSWFPLCRGLAHRAKLLADQPGSILNVRDLRPTDTLKRMKIVFNRDPAQKQLFLDSARASAVMGNCPKSRDSFRAGEFQ